MRASSSPSAREAPSRAQYEEERERRRELKGECTAMRDRVLILEARLAVSERQNTPSKASSSITTNSPGVRCAADDVDPIEESIRLVFERNKFLEARVKQLEGEQREQRIEHQQQPPSSTFEKEFRVGRKMLQVQEEIEATLTAEVGRLRQVVKAQRHAIQRLVSNPGSALEPGEYSRLTSHASPARQSSRPGRRQPAATSSAVAVAVAGKMLRSSSSSSAAAAVAAAGGSRRPLAPPQRAHVTAAHGFATRLRTSDRMASGQRRGEASDVLDLLGRTRSGSGSPTKGSPSPARGSRGGEVFLDISDRDSSSGDDKDDDGDCEDGDALPQFQLGSPTRTGPSTNSSNRSSAFLGSPTRVSAASSARPRSPDQARNPGSAEGSRSSSSRLNRSRNVEHSAPWTPTRGKEIIPNIVDFGLLSLSPALVDPNYENRVHAEANKHEHSPSKHKHKAQTSHSRRSPVGSPPSRRLGSPSSRPARKTPPPSRQTASKISQALQLEVDKILREIEASLQE